MAYDEEQRASVTAARIADFVEASNAARTTAEIFTLLADIGAEQGYDRVAYGALTGHDLYNPTGLPSPAIALNYPDDWVAHYFAHGYQRLDPVVVHTPSLWRPFQWTNLPSLVNLTPEQDRLMQECREAGLNNGLSIPLHGPFGAVSVVCFASSTASSDRTNVDSAAFNLIATLFSFIYSELAGGARAPAARVTLSPREQDCLAWSARGKSSWDIGAILDISENTVNFHIKSAMAKLGSHNRTVAIVKAIRLGLIVP